MAQFDSSNPADDHQTGADLVVTGADLLDGATILVVDDEEPNRRLLERMIGGEGGAIVHTLADPRQTVDECRRISPDLLMLDLHMPHMDGVEVITAVRDELHDAEFLPIIVLTADITSGAKERALAAGANDFLSKPFDHTEVLLRVNNLLEMGSRFAAVQIRSRTIKSMLERHIADEDAIEELHRQRDERIRHAFESNALRMVFAPISDLPSGRIVGVEALARFDLAPQRPPDEWFAEAATTGKGIELEIRAIAAALEHVPDLPDDRFLMLNASAMVAASSELEELCGARSCEQIVLSLTRQVDFEKHPKLQQTLDNLRSRGIRIAVGDTGSGYSGLRNLLRFHPEMIRLDEDLSRGIHGDPSRRALTGALLGFAEEIGSTIIAEGIDNVDDFETLRSLGVGWGQGYHISPRGPSTSVAAAFS